MEEAKICCTCKEEKELSEFSKNKSTKDGLQKRCRKCVSIDYNNNREEVKKKTNNYYYENIENVKVRTKDYRKRNKEKIGESKKRYAEENKEKLKEKRKRYYEENKEDILKKQKEYVYGNKESRDKANAKHKESHIDQIRERSKKYRLENYEELKIKKKEYRENNKEKIREMKIAEMNKPAKYETYKDQLTIEEEPICGEDGELLVRCNFCKEYFPPTNGNVRNRVQTLKGNTRGGETRLYCCIEHRESCDVAGAKILPKSMRNKVNKARCHQSLNRKMLLDLQFDQFGYTHCEVCGKPFPRKQLILHHNIPVGDDISEADNMSHQIIVCRSHHQHNGCLGKQ